jgi:ribonuclease HI
VRLLAHTDGGSSRGQAYIGVHIADADSGEVLVEHSQSLGEGTNNEAEWSALIFALYQAAALGAEELAVRADSMLVVNQFNGAWAVHENHIADYAREAASAAREVPRVTVEWVPREQNAEADRLSRATRPPKPKKPKATGA